MVIMAEMFVAWDQISLYFLKKRHTNPVDTIWYTNNNLV